MLLQKSPENSVKGTCVYQMVNHNIEFRIHDNQLADNIRAAEVHRWETSAFTCGDL